MFEESTPLYERLFHDIDMADAEERRKQEAGLIEKPLPPEETLPPAGPCATDSEQNDFEEEFDSDDDEREMRDVSEPAAAAAAAPGPAPSAVGSKFGAMPGEESEKAAEDPFAKYHAAMGSGPDPPKPDLAAGYTGPPDGVCPAGPVGLVYTGAPVGDPGESLDAADTEAFRTLISTPYQRHFNADLCH